MANFRARRAHAFKNQHGQCCYCEHSMWLTDAATFARQHGLTARQALLFKCTAEHLVARCDGGKNRQSNIAAACWWCNNRRHRRKQAPSPAVYRQLVRHRMAAGRWNPVLRPELTAVRMREVPRPAKDGKCAMSSVQQRA